MCGHIVAALIVMNIVGIIFRHGFVKKRLEIFADGGIGIFVNRERSRSMLDKYLAKARPDILNPWHGIDNFAGDQVKSPRAFLK